jgi:uncharacterized membrane protein YkoI
MTLRPTRTAGIAALTLTLGLALTACSGDDAEETPLEPGTASAEATDENGDDAGTDDGSDDAADGGAADGGEGTAGADDEAEGDGGDAGSDVLGDRTTTALAAIATAEAEIEGTAYAIDDDEATSWEVDVASGEETVTATLDGTGTQVSETATDDLDAADQEALDGANVVLSEAIQRVVGESGGTLDDAELETEDGAARWTVSVLTSAGDDEEYHVDLADGTVTQDD